MAIGGFKNRGLKRFFDSNDARYIPQQHKARIEQILRAPDESIPLDAPAVLPGLRLHPLKGNRRGQWSVKMSGNRRITFRIEDGNAYDVDLTDSH